MPDTLIFADDFQEDTGKWVWEGSGEYRVEIGDGRLAIMPDNRTYGAVNVWLKQPLPDHVRIEFDYVPARDGGQNLVFMLAATQLGGGDLIADHVHRNGHYVWITNGENAFNYKPETLEGNVVPPVASYTVSWWAPQQFKGMSGMTHRLPARKNPGHLLIGDGHIPVDAANRLASRRFALIKRGGEITVMLDGEAVHRISDTGGQEVNAITRQADGTLVKEPMTLPVHGGGHFGFRTLHMWPEFRNFRVYAIARDETAE